MQMQQEDIYMLEELREVIEQSGVRPGTGVGLLLDGEVASLMLSGGGRGVFPKGQSRGHAPQERSRPSLIGRHTPWT